MASDECVPSGPLSHCCIKLTCLPSYSVLAPRTPTFLRRRFLDEPEPKVLPPSSPEPQRPPPRSPEQVYWRYGKDAVKESEKTKAEIAKFEQEMSELRQSPDNNVFNPRAVRSESCLVPANVSPRGPRTERAHTSAGALGLQQHEQQRYERDVDAEDYVVTPPSSPSKGFLRRLFSNRKSSHPRSLADCAE